MTAAPGSPPSSPQATILITTRDRCDRLRHALQSALAQTAAVEVIVLDDASADGTTAMVGAEFPQVRLERSDAPLGCPAQRNRGFAIAAAPVVVCLDDDAWFSSPRTVAQVLAEFQDAAIAVVTIPYLNVRRERSLRQRAPGEGIWLAGTFSGGSAAFRREAFLEAGGYADFREHGEEGDLAIRLLDRGHLVRLGRSDHVVHDEAQLVKPPRTHAFSSRNHLVAVWRNVPWPYLPARLVAVAAKVLLLGARAGRLRAAGRGVAGALRVCLGGSAGRVPVRRRTYVLSRRLLRRGPLSFATVAAALPPRAPADGAGVRPLHVVSILTTHAAGGAEYAAVDLLEALRARGSRVVLLTDRPALAAGTGLRTQPVAGLGPKLRRRTVVTLAPRLPVLAARFLRAIRREARRAPIDVLLVHHKKEQLLSTLVPRSLARAVVWAEWGPLPPPLRRGPARWLYARASHAADAILAESEGTATSLRAAGVSPAKITIVPNVLDDHGLQHDAAARVELRERWGLQDAFVMGCISRLDPAKRVDVVIDALAELDPRVALVIAGHGEREDDLRRRAGPFGARVVFVGEARGAVAGILSACDVQVYAPGPSEGDARVIAFGQLVGLPVIATAPEGARNLVTPGTGTIVSPANDPRALAGVVERYRADPRRVAAEGAAGRRSALRRIRESDPIATVESVLRTVSPASEGPPER